MISGNIQRKKLRHRVVLLAGVIIIPGTTQLTAPDICYGLLASKARCVIVIHAPAPAPGVNSVASKCQSLKTKLIVSESSRAEWLNFSHLLKFEFEILNHHEETTEPKSDGTAEKPEKSLNNESSVRANCEKSEVN